MRYSKQLLEFIDNSIALLQQNDNAWLDKIDQNTLDMGSSEYCILGQLYGSYYIGKWKLDIYHGSKKPLAFDINYHNLQSIDSYDILTKAWQYKIRKLKALQLQRKKNNE